MLDKINANALIRQWIAEQRDRIPAFEHLDDFYRYINDQVCGGTAIDFLEFGVYKGHSIRLWSQMNRDLHSRFIGFDSFVGLPESWTKRINKGAFHVDGAVPQVDDLSIYQFSRHPQSLGRGRHRRRSLMAQRRPRVNQESLPRASLAG